jgi:hypothetical protein
MNGTAPVLAAQLGQEGATKVSNRGLLVARSPFTTG